MVIISLTEKCLKRYFLVNVQCFAQVLMFTFVVKGGKQLC